MDQTQIDAEKHLSEIKHKLAQEYHWEAQRWYWLGALSLVGVGLLLNALIKLF